MNLQELCEFEQHPQLSVLSRLIYVFSLKRLALSAQTSKVYADYSHIKQYVAVHLDSGKIKEPNDTQIQQALQELLATRLLQTHDAQVHAGSEVWLPLIDTGISDQAPMSLTWQPNEKLTHFLKLYGVVDCEQFTPDELQSFIAYWYARRDMRETDMVWTQKFAKQIQMNRTQRMGKNKVASFQPVGYQVSLKSHYQGSTTVDKIKRDFAPFINKESSDEK